MVNAFTNPAGANRALASSARAAADARDSAGAASVDNIRLRKRLQALEEENLEAKKALHGQVAIRNALKAALEEVAPDHELNDAEIRTKIRDDAEAKVKPDSPWWP